VLAEPEQGLAGATLGELWRTPESKAREVSSRGSCKPEDSLVPTADDAPWRKSGRKAIMKTRKIEMMQRSIHEKTGSRP
jgi:hypothetical protein